MVAVECEELSDQATKSLQEGFEVDEVRKKVLEQEIEKKLKSLDSGLLVRISIYHIRRQTSEESDNELIWNLMLCFLENSLNKLDQICQRERFVEFVEPESEQSEDNT